MGGFIYIFTKISDSGTLKKITEHWYDDGECFWCVFCGSKVLGYGQKFQGKYILPILALLGL